MRIDDSTWTGRKKRIARRLAYDLRLALPFLGVAACFVLSATAIFAAESLPLAQASALLEVSGSTETD